jgi:hypothetical protein
VTKKAQRPRTRLPQPVPRNETRQAIQLTLTNETKSHQSLFPVLGVGFRTHELFPIIALPGACVRD